MKCSVLRSSLKDFTYIYLLDGQVFKDLPVSLRRIFGEPRLVMNLDLNPERKLAYEDVNLVMKSLGETGYHLQLPPQEDVTAYWNCPKRRKPCFNSSHEVNRPLADRSFALGMSACTVLYELAQ